MSVSRARATHFAPAHHMVLTACSGALRLHGQQVAAALVATILVKD